MAAFTILVKSGYFFPKLQNSSVWDGSYYTVARIVAQNINLLLKKVQPIKSKMQNQGLIFSKFLMYGLYKIHTVPRLLGFIGLELKINIECFTENNISAHCSLVFFIY